MSFTALITHLNGVSSIHITRIPTIQINESIPLSIPSRYPEGSKPQITISPNGHFYLYAKSGTIIWEYDSRGKRSSEVNLQGDKVLDVLALGNQLIINIGNDLRTGVSTENGNGSESGAEGGSGKKVDTAKGIRVVEKIEGKWKEINRLQVSEWSDRQ